MKSHALYKTPTRTKSRVRDPSTQRYPDFLDKSRKRGSNLQVRSKPSLSWQCKLAISKEVFTQFFPDTTAKACLSSSCLVLLILGRDKMHWTHWKLLGVGTKLRNPIFEFTVSYVYIKQGRLCVLLIVSGLQHILKNSCLDKISSWRFFP